MLFLLCLEYPCGLILGCLRGLMYHHESMNRGDSLRYEGHWIEGRWR